MAQISIVWFSGYGHTTKQAEAVAEGATAAGAKVVTIAIDQEGNVPDSAWETLLASDAIVFGSPTYMGGPAWQFKKFADASSKPWFQGLWRDKVAAGFTNSASMNGDKHSTLTYFFTLSQQHGMAWIGTALPPANTKAAQRNDINYLGSSAGLMAQSPSDSSPDEGPLPGDLATAREFGKRIALFTAKVGK